MTDKDVVVGENVFAPSFGVFDGKIIRIFETSVLVRVNDKIVDEFPIEMFYDKWNEIHRQWELDDG